jgi:hypothetical protein
MFRREAAGKAICENYLAAGVPRQHCKATSGPALDEMVFRRLR